MKRIPLLLGLSVLLAATLALALAGPDVAAAADVRGAGKRVGDTLKSWAVPLFGGSVAAIASFFVITRDWPKAIGFVGLVLVLGGFVFAPEMVGSVSESLWRTVF